MTGPSLASSLTRRVWRAAPWRLGLMSLWSDPVTESGCARRVRWRAGQTRCRPYPTAASTHEASVDTGLESSWDFSALDPLGHDPARCATLGPCLVSGSEDFAGCWGVRRRVAFESCVAPRWRDETPSFCATPRPVQAAPSSCPSGAYATTRAGSSRRRRRRQDVVEGLPAAGPHADRAWRGDCGLRGSAGRRGGSSG